ncbi:CPBP family intramembrane glutamic endopeptidase [Paenibacillus sp. RC84]|uniref:CPBP family intramembrane glutamic endopeptidase n=1 Tax=Paenibacillus sp. RC84 TaxID=3156252 RepID=UPI0035143E76
MNAIFHFIALYTCLLIPISGYFKRKKLKHVNEDKAKEKAYLLLHAVYWIAALPIILIDPSVFWVRHSLELSWLWHTLFVAALVYLLVFNVLPLILIRYNAELKEEAQLGYLKRQHTLPTTNRQHHLFVWVSITVGITEEVLYRGFLYNYGIELWGLSGIASAILVSAVFGLAHFTQGPSGIISSFIFGVVMSWLYFITGSLLLPILLHILYDLKIIAVQRALKEPITTNGPGSV